MPPNASPGTGSVPSRPRTCILHIITGLDVGGAEMMLYKLLCGLDRSRFCASVVSLTDIGEVGTRIAGLDVEVRALGMRRGVADPTAVVRLARWIKRARPDVVQTWMYHADLVGGLAGRMAGMRRVVWGIRQTNLVKATTKRSTIVTSKACARLSRAIPIRIVCCSEVARRLHVELGYAAHKMIVIPNGFDVEQFRPDPESRASVRQELRIPENEVLIGLIGRFHPQKDHCSFARAATRARARHPEVRFVLCGEGVETSNPVLTGWLSEHGVLSACHLLGRRSDMPRITAALDIAVSSSSYGEGFSNAVGEAMASGVPCAVTDVGDSAYIVGDTGLVSPPGQPDCLADNLSELIAAGPIARSTLGEAARRRIMENFNLPDIQERYASLYEDLTGSVRDHRGL